jgi:hypothetical protein
MFELRLVETNTLVKFDRQLPVFNWYYPFDLGEAAGYSPTSPFASKERGKIKRRAAYIHIPFCETICNFCPFGKEKYKCESDLYLWNSSLRMTFYINVRSMQSP